MSIWQSVIYMKCRCITIISHSFVSLSCAAVSKHIKGFCVFTRLYYHLSSWNISWYAIQDIKYDKVGRKRLFAIYNTWNYGTFLVSLMFIDYPLQRDIIQFWTPPRTSTKCQNLPTVSRQREGHLDSQIDRQWNDVMQSYSMPFT